MRPATHPSAARGTGDRGPGTGPRPPVQVVADRLRRWMPVGLWAMVVAGCLASSAWGQGVKVTATASPTEVTVGQSFVVEVGAAGPAGTTWTFPDGLDSDSLQLHELPPEPGQPPEVRRYQGAAFTLGEAEVPALTVGYALPDGTSGEAHSEPVALKIVSLLPKDPEEHKLTDIRGPMGLPLGPYFWVLLVAGAGALVATILVVRRLLRRKPAPTPAVTVPAIPADQEAFTALDRLAGSGLLESGELRQYYIQLAEIAKRYLERRLLAPVLEMTSTETVAFLRDSSDAREFAPLMRELTTAADLVKFARDRGTRDVGQRQLGAVRDMVTGLEQRLAAKTAEKPLEKTA